MHPEFERLRQACSVEARHACPNLQGQHARFADFARAEVARLLDQRFLAPAPVAALRAPLDRYETLPPADRARLVQDLLMALDPPRAPEPARPAPVGSTRPATAPAAPASKPAAKGPQGLDMGVQFVKGVGPRTGEMLAKLGILTVHDLLFHLPRTHLDYQARTRLRDVKPGDRVTIWGTVRRVETFVPPSRPNLTICSVLVHDGTAAAKATWFQGKMNKLRTDQFKQRFPVGAQVLLSGEARADGPRGGISFDRPDVEILGHDGEGQGESVHVGRIVPVYALTEGLPQRTLRQAVHTCLQTFGPLVEDFLPPVTLAALDLPTRPEALQGIHFPESMPERDRARDRLAFDELFLLQLGLAYRRAQQRDQAALAMSGTGALTQALREVLPFRLTGAQERVFTEIVQDLARPEPMNRLVQGDVGSGKTVVALLTLLVAVENGFQGALMAPTEILAEQHFRKFQEWLAPMGIPVASLLGKHGKRERAPVLAGVADGTIPLLVGTHALIQDSVSFHNLGLVVIDEQHRFGVKQRAQLRAKGLHPEVLTMTATPIPRTLALTLHGDLDVSVIDELPPGRKPIVTSWIGQRQRKDAWNLVRTELEKGHQAYVVFPLIESSEELERVRSATEEAETLAREVFFDWRVGLLHGQMDPVEKESIVQAFRRHELDILVSTTVIEVGVDVPNATVMVIENAERFGLSQLHQLRGRVGRGGDQAYCVLVTATQTEATRQRMEVMTATQDGFVIAEQDLRLRGPGEFLGTRQSGLPDFVLADITRDTALLEKARKLAWKVIEQDEGLQRHPALRAALFRHFRTNLGFLGVS
ncbi:MAG: ATP-dependent DNA helicase RecG [bacterium]|nr:ATP-dependent DNA helicase RecG [bacterium]